MYLVKMERRQREGGRNPSAKTGRNKKLPECGSAEYDINMKCKINLPRLRLDQGSIDCEDEDHCLNWWGNVENLQYGTVKPTRVTECGCVNEELDNPVEKTQLGRKTEFDSETDAGGEGGRLYQSIPPPPLVSNT